MTGRSRETNNLAARHGIQGKSTMEEGRLGNPGKGTTDMEAPELVETRSEPRPMEFKEGGFSIVNVHLDPMDCSDALRRLGRRLGRRVA